ncbi:MAG TPA: patatin-like phospholipase family protein [Gaiellaceae bacterium]
MSTVETATDYGIKEYLPVPKGQRRGLALAFSGGGYRASIFHLGALRRLNELGVLTRANTITSASGGSVTTAQLARHRIEHPEPWAEQRPIADFEGEIAEPLREFARRDIRTLTVLKRFLPWNWTRPGVSIEALAERLEDGPAGKHELSELGADPAFVFCATELRFRAQWLFDTGHGRAGNEVAGFAPLSSHWTVARAAAASACFPFAFAPMSVPAEARPPGTYRGADRDSLVAKLQLVDGGLVDNGALEPVWRDHEAVLVSDASPTFKFAPTVFGPAWNVLRYVVTVLEQSVEVRKRWLISSFLRRDLEGAYWGIASRPGSYDTDAEVEFYSDSFIADVISQIRIDFDAFSDAEIFVLENHGYALAEIAMRRHARRLVAGAWPPAQVPHRDWMDEERAGRALRESARTELFGHFR